MYSGPDTPPPPTPAATAAAPAPDSASCLSFKGPGTRDPEPDSSVPSTPLATHHSPFAAIHDSSASSVPSSDFRIPTSNNPEPNPSSSPDPDSSVPSSPLATHHSPLASSLFLAAADRTTPPELVAERFGIDLLRYLDYLSHPDTQRRIDALQHARDAIDRQRDQVIHDEAVAKLRTLMNNSTDEVEQRRCATAIVRSKMSPRNHRIHSARVPSRAQSLRHSAGGAGGAGAIAGTTTAPNPLAPGHQSHLGCPPPRHRRAIIAAANTPQHSVPVTHTAARAAAAISQQLIREHDEAQHTILPPPPPRSYAIPPTEPAAITSMLLHRLQDSDNPAPGDGLRMLHYFLHEAALAELGYTARCAGIKAHYTAFGTETRISSDEFANLRIFLPHHVLVGHSSAVLEQPVILETDDKDSTQPTRINHRFTFIDARGRFFAAIFTYDRDKPTDRWKITTIRIAPGHGPDPFDEPNDDDLLDLDEQTVDEILKKLEDDPALGTPPLRGGSEAASGTSSLRDDNAASGMSSLRDDNAALGTSSLRDDDDTNHPSDVTPVPDTSDAEHTQPYPPPTDLPNSS